MSYQTQQRELRELNQKFGCFTPNRLEPACEVTGLEKELCEGPHYTLRHSWAPAAIRDRVYRPDSGPSVHWTINVIGWPGACVIVSPHYEPLEAMLDRTRGWRRSGDLFWSEADDLDSHRMEHGQSNWTTTWEMLLTVVLADETKVRGLLRGEDYCYVYLPDKALAQDVLDSLWAATQGDARAYAGATHCAFCGKALTDPLSSSRGYGPDCAKRYGLPRPRVIEGDRP